MTVIRVSAGALALLMAAILLLSTLATPAAAAGEERIGPHGAALADTAASAPFQVAQNTEPAGEPTRTELLFWDSVKDSRYPEEFEAYLDRYPEGTFAALARSRLKRLGGTEETSAAPATVKSGDAPPDASSTPSATAQGDEVYKPHKRMWVAKRADVRFGPSTGHPKVDLLEAGKKVRVVAKTGDWYRLSAQPGQGMRYVHASLLTESKPARSKAAAATEPSKKTAASPSSTAQADEVYKPYKKMWVAKHADVHAGPSTSREKIDQLRTDKSVYVASRTGDWYKLWPRPGQENRYVHVSLLTEEKPTRSKAAAATEPSKKTAASPSSTVQADEVYEPYKKMRVAKHADVHAEPSASQEKIDQLRTNMGVYVASRTGDWYKLWPRPGQENRYVHVSLLTESKPAKLKAAAATEPPKKTAASPSATAQADEVYKPYKKMQAVKRANVRAGPSTSREKIDLLEVGKTVYVASRTGDWYKLWPRPGQENRYVYAPLLADRKSASSTTAASKSTVKTIDYGNGNRYRGEVRNGKKHGRGVFTFADGSRYKGGFVNGKWSGRGVYAGIYDGGELRIEGDFLRGYLNGRGVIDWPKGKPYYYGDRKGVNEGIYDKHYGRHYEGEVKKSAPHGRGVLTFSDGRRFEGHFVNGHLNGHGVIIGNNGSRYEGSFVNSRQSGRGATDIGNGNRYEGDFVDGRFHGRGVFTWANGDRYEGGWVSGKRHGSGVFTWANGDRYEGGWVNHKRHGSGVYTWASGDSFTGEWRDGERVTGTTQARQLVRQQEGERQRRQAERQRRQAELDREWEEMERNNAAWDKFNDDITRWSTEALQRVMRNSGSGSRGSDDYGSTRTNRSYWCPYGGRKVNRANCVNIERGAANYKGPNNAATKIQNNCSIALKFGWCATDGGRYPCTSDNKPATGATIVPNGNIIGFERDYDFGGRPINWWVWSCDD